MPLLTLLLAAALQAGSVEPPFDSTLASGAVLSATEAAERDGPFEDIGAFFEWVDRNQPMSGSRLVNPHTDPAGERGIYYVLDRDSTVWIQGPDGRTLRLDAYLPYKMGLTINEELKYSASRPKGVGWGVEAGEFLIYINSGLPQRLALALLILVPLLVLAVIYGLWRRLRLATERGAQLAESRRRLADSRENERMHLARDLHDGPLQDLQALRMRLGVVQRAAERGAPLPDAALDPVQADLLRVVHELRSVSEGLRPPVLGPFGLAAALRALATRARETHPDLTIDLDLQADGTRLSEAARIALYRVVQESINNAAVHGRAHRVTVTYRERDGVRLVVEDDGTGFTMPDAVFDLEREGHLGVAGMSERAEAIGGTFAVDTRPGAGTRVLVTAPPSVFSTPIPA